MATYTIACYDCEETWDIYCPMGDRDNPHFCPHCGMHTATRRIIQPISFKFSEADRPGDSSKPDSYWENAEREKKRKLVKKQNDAIEQGFYNDPNTPARFKDVKNHVK